MRSALKKQVGVILIGLMFFSTIGFAVGQSFFVSTPNTVSHSININPIINYTLSTLEYQELINNGITIMTYEYGEKCIICEDEKRILKNIIFSEKFQKQTNIQINQIILEQIKSGSSKYSKFQISSKFLNATTYPNQIVIINNITEKNVENVLCESVLYNLNC